MRLFDDPQEQVHAPLVEMHNGGFLPYREHSRRIDSVSASIGGIEQPAVILLERGYSTEALGANVATFLHEFEPSNGLSGA